MPVGGITMTPSQRSVLSGWDEYRVKGSLVNTAGFLIGFDPKPALPKAV